MALTRRNGGHDDIVDEEELPPYSKDDPQSTLVPSMELDDEDMGHSFGVPLWSFPPMPPSSGANNSIEDGDIDSVRAMSSTGASIDGDEDLNWQSRRLSTPNDDMQGMDVDEHEHERDFSLRRPTTVEITPAGGEEDVDGGEVAEVRLDDLGKDEMD